jgi:tetratricopeptide (TPR) repeat protein
LLVLATLAAYQPVWHAGFVWDDDATLTANPLIQAPDGLAKFWLSTEPIDYWPVTYTTLWAEWRVWGDAPLGYHVTNLFLHLLVVGMVWLVLRRLKIPGAWWAALLFAVHPVNVETVAWMAQRKTLLAALFFLISVYSYVRTGLAESEAPERGGERAASGRGWYWASLVAFVLAMLSKGSAATLPLVLLGLVAWRRRVNWADGARMAPFFAVAGGLTLVNIWFQSHGVHPAIRHATVVERVLGAAAAVWFYLGKAVWPAGLMFIYPQWDIRADELRWWVPLFAAVALTTLLWRQRQTGWGRAGLLAWFYFVVTLAPVMGFVDVYFMKYALVADHYQYLSIIGVAALAGAGLQKMMEGPETRRQMVAAGAGLVMVALGVLTWRDCAKYADAETLWRATLAENPNALVGWDALGHLAFSAGRVDEAVADFKRMAALDPEDVQGYNNLGVVYLQLGRPDAAVGEYRAALKIEPDFAQTHYNLGNVWLQQGRWDEAMGEYRAALRIQPDYPEARSNLGAAEVQAGREEAAAGEFRQVLKIQPDNVSALNNLAWILATAPQDSVRHGDEAVALAGQASRLTGGENPAMLRTLAAAEAEAGRWPEAVATAQRALALAERGTDAGLVESLREQLGFYEKGLTVAQAGKVP